MEALTLESSEEFFLPDEVTPTNPVAGCNFSNMDPTHAVCNLTCCNFGNGCVVDFSKQNLTPWVRLESSQLALFSVGVALEAVPAVLENLLVILIILGSRVMRNDINLFILNMAAADLVSAAVLPSTFLIRNAYQAYELGAFWCRYGESFRLTLLLTSVLSLVVVSVDRLWGLMRPFHRPFRPVTTIAIMLATWIVAVAVAAYPSKLTLYSMRQYADFLDIICEEQSEMKMYWWLIAVFMVWLPACVLFGCFLLIFIKLRYLTTSQHKSGRLRFIPPVPRSRRRAVVLLFSMFVTFIVCWSPFLVYVLLYQYGPADHDTGKAVEILYYVSHFMMYLVPVINPLLYALIHENFRRAVTTVLPCLPTKVKYKGFRAGAGSHVHWSIRGQSLPPQRLEGDTRAESAPPRNRVLRRAHTLAEIPSGRHEGGATVGEPAPAATISSAEITVTPPQREPREPRRGPHLDEARMREVTLIWNALMEQQAADLLTVPTLSDIAEESESRKTSIATSIDLADLVREAPVTPVREAPVSWNRASRAMRVNNGYLPE